MLLRSQETLLCACKVWLWAVLLAAVVQGQLDDSSSLTASDSFTSNNTEVTRNEIKEEPASPTEHSPNQLQPNVESESKLTNSQSENNEGHDEEIQGSGYGVLEQGLLNTNAESNRSTEVGGELSNPNMHELVQEGFIIVKNGSVVAPVNNNDTLEETTEVPDPTQTTTGVPDTTQTATEDSDSTQTTTEDSDSTQTTTEVPDSTQTTTEVPDSTQTATEVPDVIVKPQNTSQPQPPVEYGRGFVEVLFCIAVIIICLLSVTIYICKNKSREYRMNTNTRMVVDLESSIGTEMHDLLPKPQEEENKNNLKYQDKVTSGENVKLLTKQIESKLPKFTPVNNANNKVDDEHSTANGINSKNPKLKTEFASPHSDTGDENETMQTQYL